MRKAVPAIVDYPKETCRDVNRVILAKYVLSFFKDGDCVIVKNEYEYMRFGYSAKHGYHFSLCYSYPCHLKSLSIENLAFILADYSNDSTFISRAFKKLRKIDADRRSLKSNEVQF